ncbi:MAG: RNA methyltransferase, partial [Clostridiales bacterium]
MSHEAQIMVVCGHYEGIDQRVIDCCNCELISLGDFVLTGGETAAIAIADSVTRLLPGALGDDASAEEESFTGALLEYPQYTRPAEYQGLSVPAVLQNGNHQLIALWRRQQSLLRTYHYRPELLAQAALTLEDVAFLNRVKQEENKPFRLYTALVHYPVYNKKREIINTSLTNLDLHDIARAAITYGLAGYYLIQPLLNQQQLIDKLLEHWRSGFGARYNPDRQRALA